MMSAEQPAIVLPTDSTPVAQSAALYVAIGMLPIPVHGVTRDGHCTCGQDCPSPGKHPVGNEWQKRASLDLDDVRERFRSHTGNIGIYLGKTQHVLVDADGDVGLATAAMWNLPPTLQSLSGSGAGGHWIYELGTDQNARAISDRRVAPGLDVKAHGQFVAAPSRHTSGGIYRWTNAVVPAVMPDWLFDRLRKPVRVVPAPPPSYPPEDRGSLEKRARAYLAKCDSAISGSGGHNATFAAARGLVGWVHKGLASSAAWALLVEYNARCEPPWAEHELKHKWNSALSATTIPRIEDRPRAALHSVGSTVRMRAAPEAEDDGGPTPPSGGEPPPPVHEPDWKSELLWSSSKNGADKLVSHVDNVIRILQLAPEWRGRIGFDDFRSRIVVTDPPWDKYQKPTHARSFWTDEDGTRLHAWMRRRFHREVFCPTVNDCERGIAIVAHNHGFHPVRDYLGSVSWDGTPRLATWLATYFGAEQSEYTRLVGAWWLISAVARIYQPGCKVDTVPILEGEQGIKKSSALKILAGAEWFNDTPIDIGSKDAYTAIQGCWFVELAELESLMRAEPSRSKAFFSSSKDHFRRAYARHETDELRQCVFVGTVNLKEYLNDPTGSRRFWPLQCVGVDLEAIERDRDQLWAEAVHEYEEGRVWYPQAETERAMLGERQENTTKSDAWEPRIDRYLARLGATQTTMDDVLLGALNLEPKDWTHATQTRVGVIMTSRLKWRKRRLSDSTGKRYWTYMHPDNPLA